MPDGAPLAEELKPQTPGPTLAGAVVGDVASKKDAAPEEPEAPPMTPEQIIGVVAELSAFGLPAGLADAYKDDFKTNPLVALGVQFSGLADALAAYGVTGAGGKMPEWLSVSLGIAVLGYGVYTTRSKYVPHETQLPAATEAAPAGDAGFAGAGYGAPLSQTDFGFSDAGQRGGDPLAAP